MMTVESIQVEEPPTAILRRDHEGDTATAEEDPTPDSALPQPTGNPVLH